MSPTAPTAPGRPMPKLIAAGIALLFAGVAFLVALFRRGSMSAASFEAEKQGSGHDPADGNFQALLLRIQSGK